MLKNKITYIYTHIVENKLSTENVSKPISLTEKHQQVSLLQVLPLAAGGRHNAAEKESGVLPLLKSDEKLSRQRGPQLPLLPPR